MKDRTFETSPFYLTDRELIEATDICLCVLMLRNPHGCSDEFQKLSEKVRELKGRLF